MKLIQNLIDNTMSNFIEDYDYLLQKATMEWIRKLVDWFSLSLILINFVWCHDERELVVSRGVTGIEI